MNNIQAIEFIKMKRSAMSQQKLNRSANRVLQIPPYPLATERVYGKNMIAISQGSIDSIDNVLNTFTDKHFDSISADIDSLWAQMKEEYERYYGTTIYRSGNIGSMLFTIAGNILGMDSAFMQKQMSVIAGEPFIIDTPWWPSVRDLWAQENYNLISSMGNDYITSLNKLLLCSVSTGMSKDELALSIAKLQKGMTSYHAKLIARDQVGKLNALVQKEQAMYIGINSYYWHTARDEKVRGAPGRYARAIPSHYVMEGLLCTWEDNAVYSDDLGKTWKKKTALMELNQVGMAIQCRCLASLSWNEFVQNLDKEVA